MTHLRSSSSGGQDAAAETIYANDDRAVALQRLGYRCRGRTPAGEMIMRLPTREGSAFRRPPYSELVARIETLEATTARQAEELACLREQLKTAKRALPETHPLRRMYAEPPEVCSELSALRQAVADAFQVTLPRLCGGSRERFVVRARHAFWTLARDRGGYALETLAQAVGRSDHTSVGHGIGRTRDHWFRDPDFIALYARAEELADNA